MENDLLELINKNISKFSNNDFKIISFILSDRVKNKIIKVNDIIYSCQVGYSSVYSFIGKLGLKSIKQLSYMISERNLKAEINAKNYESHFQNPISLFYFNIIEKNQEELNLKKIEISKRELMNKKHIYFLGFGDSYLACKIMSDRLTRFGFNSVVLEREEGMFLSKINFMKRDEDLLFLISISGETKAILDAAELASSRKIKTISLTQFADSPLTQMCYNSHNIFFPILKGANECFISPLFSLVYFFDLFTMKIISDDIDGYYKKWNSTSELITNKTKTKKE